jgi:hypothetical protein
MPKTAGNIALVSSGTAARFFPDLRRRGEGRDELGILRLPIGSKTKRTEIGGVVLTVLLRHTDVYLTTAEVPREIIEAAFAPAT